MVAAVPDLGGHTLMPMVLEDVRQIFGFEPHPYLSLEPLTHTL